VAKAIVDDTTFGSERNSALLLMSRLLDEPPIAEDLQIDQAGADGVVLNEQDGAEKVEAGVPAGSGIRGRHSKSRIVVPTNARSAGGGICFSSPHWRTAGSSSLRSSE